jgi:uncharacterized protein YcbX
VAWLASAPVKSMALIEHGAVQVGLAGIAGDRRYALIDPHDRLVSGKRIGPLATIVPGVRENPEALALHFPDGSVVEEDVVAGRAVSAVFYGEGRPAHEVAGSFSRVLSEWAGQPLRLVRLDDDGGGIDRSDEGGGFSLVSSGSLLALAQAAGLAEPLDPRRFRMSSVIEGVEPYAEDGWLGRRVQLGEVVVTVRGNIGRCAVTTHDPATGLRSLDTLKLLAETRADVATSEPLPFGVFATVLVPGTIRLGDAVTILDDGPGTS